MRWTADQHDAWKAREAARESEFFARAFIRRAEAPKQTPDVEYRFLHLRREGTPDEIPAIPTLAEALGV